MNKWLSTPIQRGLFLVGCLGLIPWVAMRLIRELWLSAGLADYARNVFTQPVAPWFESAWWWYSRLEWYDWPTRPSLCLIGLALAWPRTGALLVNWVLGRK